MLPHLIFSHYCLRPPTPPYSKGSRPDYSPLMPSLANFPIYEYPKYIRPKFSLVTSSDDDIPTQEVIYGSGYDSKTFLLLILARKKLELLKLDLEDQEELEAAKKEWEEKKDEVVERVKKKWDAMQEVSANHGSSSGKTAEEAVVIDSEED